MTPWGFIGWCVAVAFGGGFAIFALGLALAFAVRMIGDEIVDLRRRRT